MYKNPYRLDIYDSKGRLTTLRFKSTLQQANKVFISVSFAFVGQDYCKVVLYADKTNTIVNSCVFRSVFDGKL